MKLALISVMSAILVMSLILFILWVLFYKKITESMTKRKIEIGKIKKKK